MKYIFDIFQKCNSFQDKEAKINRKVQAAISPSTNCCCVVHKDITTVLCSQSPPPGQTISANELQVSTNQGNPVAKLGIVLRHRNNI